MIPRYSTPWGWTDELRRDRLSPGPGADREFVDAHQRNRMMAAAVAAVAENGYRDTRVADIVRISGVSRSAFYKRFDNKAHCFRETAKAVWEQAYEIPEFGTARVADVGRWADRYPACAQFALDAPHGHGREHFEQEIVMWTKVFARRSGCPPLVARAVVAGGLRATAASLSIGDSAEKFGADFASVAWGAYGHEAISVQRSRRKQPQALAAVPENPRDRFLAAVTDLLAEGNGAPPTVAHVADRAKASLSTFYGRFGGLDDLIAQAEAGARHWSESAVSLEGWLRSLAAHPAAARLAILHRPHGLHVPLRLRQGLPPFGGRVVDAVVTALLAHEIESGRGAEVHNLAWLVEYLIASAAGSAQGAVAA